MISRCENIVKCLKKCGLSRVMRTIGRLKMVEVRRRRDMWIEAWEKLKFKIKIITYIVCSLFDVRIISVYVYNLESFSFARWRSANFSTSFLVTDLPILKQFGHSPVYGCPLSVANTPMCGERERWALAFGRKCFLKNCGTLSRGFGLRSFRPKLTNLNILRIGKSVFVFVEWTFTVNLRPTKTTQPEIFGGISGQKLLRPKPLESVPPQFFAPLPSPSK